VKQEVDMTTGLWEAIRNRRSIGRVKQDPLDRKQIEALLGSDELRRAYLGL